MLQRLLLAIQTFLKRLTPAQRATYGILLVAGGAGLATALYLGTRPSYSTAFSNLDGADGAAIAKKLDDLKVPYRVAQGGGAIEVPEEDVARVRMIMAGEALPKGSGSGFEIFDEVDVGLTDSLFEVKKLRAYQTRLQNAIASLAPVLSCQVTLSVPRQSVFVREQKRPSASVVLKLRGGMLLAPAQVGAIAHLVSAAVGQGMGPQDVTIVDTNLNLLSRPTDSHDEAAGGDLLTIQKSLEEHLTRKAQTLLDETIGAHKALVRVSAELMTDRIEETEHKVDPDTATPARERKTSHDSSGNATEGAASAAAAVQGTAGSPSSPPRSDTESETESTFVFSESSRSVKRDPGQIQRLSVALMLDQALADKRTDLEQIVQRAVGFKSDRGDLMQTSAVTFSTPAAPAEPDGGGFDRFLPMVRYLSEAIVVVVALFLLRSVLTRIKLPPGGAAAPLDAPAPHDAAPTAEDRDLLFRDVVSAAKRDPSQAANILNEWMSDDEVAAR
ncbi:MAG: flagellar basal-body MS-ring/collar protein FliF [Planctomycetota bacterium]